MNVLQNIEFSTDQPNVAIIKKNEKIKYLAVALGEKAILKKHTTPVPTTLLVARGQIKFKIEKNEYILNEFDVLEIPVLIEHEVVGLQKENLFFLTQELL